MGLSTTEFSHDVMALIERARAAGDFCPDYDYNERAWCFALNAIGVFAVTMRAERCERGASCRLTHYQLSAAHARATAQE